MVLPTYQKGAAAAKVTPAAKPKASPKKRGRPAAPQAADAAAKAEPSRKRTKAATEKFTAIAAALEEAHDVPVPVRKMLCSSLVGFSSCEGEVHPFQENVLRMLSQTLQGVDSQMAQKLQDTNVSAVKTKEDLENKEKVNAEAEAALAASCAHVREAEKLLADGAADIKTGKVALAKTQAEIQIGDGLIGAKAMEIEQVLKILSHMSEDVSCEESLRGMLRDLSIPVEQFGSQLQDGLSRHIVLLREAVSQAALARANLVAKIKSVQASMDAATQTQQTGAESLAKAQSESAVCEAAATEAGRRLKQQKTLNSQNIKALRVAHQQLTEFRQGGFAAFKSIAHEIDQQNGTCLVGDSCVKQADPLATPPQLDTELAEASDFGTPIIDRSNRQAVMRRRSAALPLQYFSRLSLLKRRSSMLANRTALQAVAGQQNNAGCDDDAGEDAGKPMPKSDGRFVERPSDVPTPSRNSTGSAVQHEDAVAAC
jgi:hypothetical protein